MKEIHIHNSENLGTILKYCSWIPAIMIMTMIFQFSAANGVESSGRVDKSLSKEKLFLKLCIL